MVALIPTYRSRPGGYGLPPGLRSVTIHRGEGKTISQTAPAIAANDVESDTIVPFREGRWKTSEDGTFDCYVDLSNTVLCLVERMDEDRWCFRSRFSRGTCGSRDGARQAAIKWLEPDHPRDWVAPDRRQMFDDLLEKLMQLPEADQLEIMAKVREMAGLPDIAPVSIETWQASEELD